MNPNPPFPSVDDSSTRDAGQFDTPTNTPPPSDTQAADLIRQKIARIYADEPDAFAEEKQVASIATPLSKHQQFIQSLSESGKSLAEIQTAWHAYYATLPDAEKHDVWREFYAQSDAAHSTAQPTPSHTSVAPRTPMRGAQKPLAAAAPTVHPQAFSMEPATMVDVAPDPRSPKTIRENIRHTVSAGGRLHAKHHLQSLLFGVGVGSVALIIFLFGFFNEMVIAPFIQPSRDASATPIIVDPSSVTASTTPEIIIPKIHLEIPVDYSQTSTNEATIENALENGIVHYPSTVMPGQLGNAAFFGHSSNNIFNPGKYKFAFVLLHELEAGDTFYVTYNGKAYIYKVFSRQIVSPSDVGVLSNVPGHTATATLITCDPPGTSINRLVVIGDQISPDPSTDTSGTNTAAPSVSSQLPGNGPSLFSRLWSSIF